uniref:Uncharacterized protein n=1 Tax=Minutocellus polymorphus TaxID=265543 RepID=A0A8A6KHJ6_9STRA|nr:hypothetical protein LV971_mgp14 [Minutocellus polymorphus]QTI83163.1 hypothetical protein [Minutocellus polymorphus]
MTVEKKNMIEKKTEICEELPSPPCLYKTPNRQTTISSLPAHSELLRDLQAREAAESLNPTGYGGESYKTPKRGFVNHEIETLEAQMKKMSVADSGFVRPSTSTGIKIEGEKVSINNISLTVDSKSPKKISREIISSKNDNENWWTTALSEIAEEDLNVSFDFLDSDE